MQQSGLDDYEGDRPAAEAVAVAGDASGGTQPVVDLDDHRFPDADGHREIAVMQVDYTLEGAGRDERPVLHVFGRTTDEDLEHVRLHGFQPYFYAPTASLTDEKLDRDAIIGTEEGYASIRGESLTRIYARTPRDVGEMRDAFDHFEADILFPNRFLIDKGITSGLSVPVRRADDGAIDVPHDEVEAVDASANLRVHTFDIEVDDRSGFPEDGEEPIICLTSHDSYRDEYIVWHFVAPDGSGVSPSALPDHDLLEDGDVEVRAFETESAMLAAYLDYVNETDVDLLTGWNVDEFDAPYLISRLQRLDSTTEHDLDYHRLSRVNEVWESDWQGPNIKGRVVFDLLYGYKRTQFSELDSYRLDAVAEAELGESKERYTGDIGDLWETDPARLLEYNLRDVELCVALDRKQEIVAFWREVATFVGCKIEDAPTAGDAVDMYVLHKASGEFALPSKGRQSGEEFEGGAVFEPITGVREMVAVFDLASLYPMSMTTVNASPETKVDPSAYNGETYVTPNGTHFRKEPDGIIREMVDELLAEREEKKALRDEHDPDSASYALYDRQQAAVKVIMNALYGTLGWTRFRLYDKEMSAAVTATGRAVIAFTADVVDDLGYEVVYGDTDSVLLEFGGDASTDAAIDIAFDLEAAVNERYDEFAAAELNATEHRFELEFEKLYRRFFQAGKKKRYAGHVIWKEGNDVDDIDITGFEYKRSDIAPITKRVQREVIEMIVRGEELDAVKDYVAEVIEDFEAGNVDLDDVGIPGGIGKQLDDYDTDTAQVRGAKYANLLLGTNFQRGSKPKRLYLEKGGVHPRFYERVEAERGLDTQRDPLYREFRRKVDAGDGVICFEYADQVPDDFNVDWEKMLEKTLRGPIARVLEALDISWDEVKSGQEQTGLESYM
ncbi:MAG: DNA-directed DNA polymerase [Halobacteriales archaeon]